MMHKIQTCQTEDYIGKYCVVYQTSTDVDSFFLIPALILYLNLLCNFSTNIHVTQRS